MTRKRGIEHVMSERWPKLRERAERETDPEKLIAILEEIDDVLFNLEMRVAAQSRQTYSRDHADSTSVDREFDAVRPGNPETESQ